MKKIKKLFAALGLILSMSVAVYGCKSTTTTKKNVTNTTTEKKSTEVVKVKKIKKAKAVSASNQGLRFLKYEAEPTTSSNDINYAILMMDEHTVEITVYVDNPKAVEINMMELKSDDDSAKVTLIDNGEKIVQSIKEQPVVKWNSSSPYQSTYTLITTTVVNDVEFEIVDFKVNGEWQKAEDMGNNTLHVYKIDMDVIQFDLITNVKNGDYDYTATFTFNVKEKYADVVKFTKVDLKGAVKDEETGIYTVNYTSANVVPGCHYDLKISETIKIQKHWHISIFSPDWLNKK